MRLSVYPSSPGNLQNEIYNLNQRAYMKLLGISKGCYITNPMTAFYILKMGAEFQSVDATLCKSSCIIEASMDLNEGRRHVLALEQAGSINLST